MQLLNKYMKDRSDKIEDCEMSTKDFNALFRVYVENNWVGMDCYNAFIKGFGAKFDKFESKELVEFVSLLQRAGLN